MIMPWEKNAEVLKALGVKEIELCDSYEIKKVQNNEQPAKHDNGIRSESENLKIYEKAIETFGQQSQINVAIEEMSELTKELCKLNRGRDNKAEILEEIADVYIMLHQLTLIFDNGVEAGVIKNIDEKTKRLENLLK